MARGNSGNREQLPCLLRKAFKKPALMQRVQSCPSMDQGIQMAVISVRTNSLIGDICLKREDAICWIGYTISPDNARQGYIREVIPAVITPINEAK